MFRKPIKIKINIKKSLLILLFVGFLIRLLIAPITYGGDFYLFEKSAELTLNLQNIYTKQVVEAIGNIPLFSYPPLFLYLLIPLKYISQKIELFSGINIFIILGKLPAMLADLGIAYLIYLILRKKYKNLVPILASSIFLFNPLVIYNSAFYGRFDSVPLLFLLLAMLHLQKKSSPIFQGIAIAIKTFPIFILPGFIFVWAKQSLKKCVLSLSIPLVVSLPFLVLNLPYFLVSVFFLHLTKPARRLSWQMILPPGENSIFFSVVLLGFFCFLAIWLTTFLIKKRDLENLVFYSATIFTLFVILSKVVYEQYLIWSLPFLLLVSFQFRSPPALILYVLFSISGLIFNEFTHCFDAILPYYALGMAVVSIFCIIIMIKQFKTRVFRTSIRDADF